jgi:hypothetical protein
MTQHSLQEAVRKLLPYVEAEQEALYKVTLKYPGRQKAQSDYEDCRHAVSYAYEALSEAGRKSTPGAWEDILHSEHAGFLIKRNGCWNPATPRDKALMIAAPEMRDALEFVAMTFADIEASKRKGYYTECPKIVSTAIAKATA